MIWITVARAEGTQATALVWPPRHVDHSAMDQGIAADEYSRDLGSCHLAQQAGYFFPALGIG